MPWVTFDHGGERYVGSLTGDTINIQATVGGPIDVITAIRYAPNVPVVRVPISEVTLLSPIPSPPSIRDFVGFEQHLINGGGGQRPPEVWYELPIFYFSSPASTCGPFDSVSISPGSRAFDYELEVAAVIGRSGINIPLEEASDYICGFTIMCDFSARDLQAKEGKLGLGPSKGKDGATSFGPVLVTPSELANFRSERGYRLRMTASVNGHQYSDGYLDDMYWSFEQMVSYASRGTRLVPGDMIGSGTVGTGCILEHRMLGRKAEFPWLKPGDQVDLFVEGIGGLSHRILAPDDVTPLWPTDHTMSKP